MTGNNRLKILIITRYFPPYNSIASLRPYSWAKYWTRAGHEVHVLTYPEEPNYNTGLSYDLSAFTMHFARNPLLELLKTELGVKAGRGRATTSENKPGLFRRLLKFCIDRLASRLHDCRMPNVHDFWYFNALSQVSDTSWDVVVSTYAPPVTHLVARTLKRQGLARVWCADFRDLWTGHCIAPGIFPFTVAEGCLERSVCNEADMVTVVSKPQADTLIRKYANSNVKVIYNGFDYDDINALPDTSYIDKSKLTLLYTGTLYKEKSDPKPLFEAVQSLKKDITYNKLTDRLRVVFVGGSFIDINSLIREHDLTDMVSYNGCVDRTTSLAMQRDADVLLFLSNEKDSLKGVMTGKIFEYLCSGTKIWGIGISENNPPGNLIVQSKAGEVLGNDVEAIKNALKCLLMDKSNRKTTTLDKTIIDMFTRENMANEMLKLITQLRYIE